MLQVDLEAARAAWIDEAMHSEERAAREQSDFLRYEDSSGRFADFHALRHSFISLLTRSGVSPKVTQTLARHSDIRLTVNCYTHLEVHDQVAAIAMLPKVRATAGSKVAKA